MENKKLAKVLQFTAAGLLFFCCASLHAAPPADAAASTTVPVTMQANSIYVVSTGFSLAGTSTLSITPGCPTGFRPYVTVSSGDSGQDNYVFGGKKVCVSSATQSAGTVTANITSTSYSFSVSGTSSGKHVSNNPDSWTVWDAEDMPKNDTISTTASTNTSGHIFWTLYCYPPAKSPPDPVSEPPTYNCT